MPSRRTRSRKAMANTQCAENRAKRSCLQSLYAVVNQQANAMISRRKRGATTRRPSASTSSTWLRILSLASCPEDSGGSWTLLPFLQPTCSCGDRRNFYTSCFRSSHHWNTPPASTFWAHLGNMSPAWQGDSFGTLRCGLQVRNNKTNDACP